MATIRAVLFDLDGTLVDSAPDILNAANHTLNQLHLPSATPSQVAHWVGNGLETFIKRALTGDFNGEPDSVLLKEALASFIKFYESNVCVSSRLYRNVAATLAWLSSTGLAMAIVTNKASGCTQPLLSQLGIKHYFSSIVCGDSCEQKKPHPAQIELALQQLGLSAGHAIMVGDSAHDINAANAVNIPVIAVNYGYAQGADLSAMNTLAVVDDISLIKEFV